MLTEPSRAAPASATQDVVVVPPADGRPGAARAYKRLAVWLALSDSTAILAAFLLAYLLRFGLRPPPLDFVLVMAVVPPLWVAIATGWHLLGVHRLAPAEEFRRLVAGISVCVTLVVTVSFWSKSSFSRMWVGLSWILSLILVLATRRAWHRWMGRRKADGRLAFRTLIVGANEEAERLAHVIRSHPVGFAPIGFVSNGNGIPELDGLPVLGEVGDLRGTIQRSGADCVFAASTAITSEEMRAVAKAARLEGVELRVSANLPQTLSTRIAAQPVAGVMTLALRPVRLTGTQAVLKRTVDILVSSVWLILLAPVLAAIAVAIKLSSDGPVLFRQERIGRRSQPFTLLKFRTMIVGADAMVGDLLDLNEATGPMFKIRQDPRVTPLGRFLRRWSLDELPQLINVLKGEMNLVGPRPALPDEVAAYEEWHFDRLEVRPGITGLWQVSGRSELSFDDYVRLDLFYIENWSLTYDVYILAKTVPAVLSRKGSF